MGKLNVVAAVGAFAVALTVAGAAGSGTTVNLRGSTTTTNLLVNPGAESGGTQGWEPHSTTFTRCGNGSNVPFRNRAYTDSDVPDQGRTFGNRLFTGNNSDGDISQKCMLQVVNLRPYTRLLHRPHASYRLSAWLGVAGGEEVKDDVFGRVCFFGTGASAKPIRCSQIAALGPTGDRLLFRSTSGPTPQSAVFAIVEFQLDYDPPDHRRNRASFDNASFTLSG